MEARYCQKSTVVTSATPFWWSVATVCMLMAVGMQCWSMSTNMKKESGGRTMLAWTEAITMLTPNRGATRSLTTATAAMLKAGRSQGGGPLDRFAPRTIIIPGIIAPPIVSNDSFTIARGASGPTRSAFAGGMSPIPMAAKQHLMGNVKMLLHLTLKKARRTLCPACAKLPLSCTQHPVPCWMSKAGRDVVDMLRSRLLGLSENSWTVSGSS
mmetsp:Transcript_39157/g.92753  ORF Transcript_39157/g.92753 Transcript_39157/m.92753 type:complete len:212 (+) Transcript_39157:281-916(+)